MVIRIIPQNQTSVVDLQRDRKRWAPLEPSSIEVKSDSKSDQFVEVAEWRT